MLGRPQPLIKSNPMDIDEQIITLPMTSDSPLSNKTKWGVLDYFAKKSSERASEQMRRDVKRLGGRTFRDRIGDRKERGKEWEREFSY